MKYVTEIDLDQFEAWSGGWDTLKVLIDRGVCNQVEQMIDEWNEVCDEPLTATQINDILWFERDQIAEYLGYEDWVAFENEEGQYNDINGVKLEVSDEVNWHDEAGYDEDGSMITFTIVEERGDGYFNLANEDEENPERWAYYTELEIV